MCLVGCIDTNTHFGRDYSEERRIEAYCLGGIKYAYG